MAATLRILDYSMTPDYIKLRGELHRDVINGSYNLRDPFEWERKDTESLYWDKAGGSNQVKVSQNCNLERHLMFVDLQDILLNFDEVSTEGESTGDTDLQSDLSANNEMRTETEDTLDDVPASDEC